MGIEGLHLASRFNDSLIELRIGRYGATRRQSQWLPFGLRRLGRHDALGKHLRIANLESIRRFVLGAEDRTQLPQLFPLRPQLDRAPHEPQHLLIAGAHLV